LAGLGGGAGHTRPAEDAGGLHRGEEQAVEAGVAGQAGAAAAFGVQQWRQGLGHGVSLTAVTHALGRFRNLLSVQCPPRWRGERNSRMSGEMIRDIHIRKRKSCR